MIRFCTFLLLSLFSLYASSLEIKSTQMACVDKKEGTNKGPFKYRYGIEMIIQNNEKKPVIITSVINTVIKQHDNKSYQVTLSHQERVRGDTVLIPSKSKLELVELLPGDSTLISHQFSDKNLIDIAQVEFFSRPLYDGRFNVWSGRLTSKDIKPQILSKCKK
ncbi:MAG: hypothetical protein ACPGTQ_06750 [Colwellia sp.]